MIDSVKGDKSPIRPLRHCRPSSAGPLPGRRSGVSADDKRGCRRFLGQSPLVPRPKKTMPSMLRRSSPPRRTVPLGRGRNRQCRGAQGPAEVDSSTMDAKSSASRDTSIRSTSSSTTPIDAADALHMAREAIAVLAADQASRMPRRSVKAPKTKQQRPGRFRGPPSLSTSGASCGKVFQAELLRSRSKSGLAPGASLAFGASLFTARLYRGRFVQHRGRTAVGSYTVEESRDRIHRAAHPFVQEGRQKFFSSQGKKRERLGVELCDVEAEASLLLFEIVDRWDRECAFDQFCETELNGSLRGRIQGSHMGRSRPL